MVASPNYWQQALIIAHPNADQQEVEASMRFASSLGIRLILEREDLAGGVLCARCGDEIAPQDHWDLGHLDGGGPREYSGPEHAACNRATSSHAKDRDERRVSRIW